MDLCGWTGKEKTPPWLPSDLRYTLFRENPMLMWEPVEEADGYYIYCWDTEDKDFFKIGGSCDSTYMDLTFKDIPEAGIIYSIVQAYNDYGKGYATNSLSILKELKIPEGVEESAISAVETGDDVAVSHSETTRFDGEYHRTDYFDYEYTMAQFRAFYEKELEAYRQLQKDEQDSFEAWKKGNDWRGEN